MHASKYSNLNTSHFTDTTMKSLAKGRLQSVDRVRSKAQALIASKIPKSGTMADYIQYVNHLKQLETSDKKRSAQLAGYVRDEIHAEMYLGYLHTAKAILRTLAPMIQAQQFRGLLA